MYRYVHTDILTPLDKYQDQVQEISEPYGKTQSFQEFCKARTRDHLLIYLTEMVLDILLDGQRLASIVADPTRDFRRIPDPRTVVPAAYGSV